MPTTTPTMLDQINVEKTKVSERLARLDADRAKIATQLTDLETAERVLTRVSKTPPARRSTSTTAMEARASTATRGRGRPPKAAANKSAERKPRRAEPRRACSCPGHRQNPTGTLRSMSQRSPEPCRHGGTAPYPRGTDPGARRQTLCDTDRKGAGTRDSLTRDHRSAAARFSTGSNSLPRSRDLHISVRITGVLGERSQVG